MQLCLSPMRVAKATDRLMGDGKPADILIRDVEYSYKEPTAAYEIIGDSIEHKASEAILAYWGHDFIRKMNEGMFAAGIEKSAKENDLSKKAEYEKKLKTVLQERENEKK